MRLQWQAAKPLLREASTASHAGISHDKLGMLGSGGVAARQQADATP
jgi:hypothetical protein